ncbi:SpaH/EbpB family LPXTG-anchored major pilin [Streptococcus parasuis]|uniref:SpaH/EbpB family LPXTG-anchored major pilin n=1 Tax=Streptococcus parasuis TaxID=1501662 RepID=UPI001C200F16|nr:SpaH/EbpB family LPXTG-anchored major pilin [Streptococcus parasuis]QWV86165.1 SpaH/EbpB family LPXTG-anchored major pilin [Streptococcus parasuis]WFB91605.1 SpaH/EbpB family LPXTG-anchored major pilin [Streptococcus parasuis]
MKKIKVFALLATLFVGIFSNLFTPVVSAADAEEVSITLHKVKDYAGGTITNTGEILPGAFNFLPGITFDAYDVTTEYYTAYDASVATKTVSEAIADAVAAVQGAAGVAPLGKTAVNTQTTAADGSATFNLSAKSGTRDAVYLFVEQASDGVTTIADNLVVSLPIYKQGTDDVLTNIHLYPKNITKETPFDKEITSIKNGAKQTDFSIGQIIDYKLKTTIPADIAATKSVEVEGQAQAKKLYNVFKFVDTFKSDQLSFINEAATFSVTVAGGVTLTNVEDYAVTVATDAGTTTVTTALTAAGIDKLATHANKEISFDYKMKINSLQYIDTPIVNTAKAIFGNDGTTGLDTWDDETPTDSETVKTGGYKFVKVDVNNNKKTLAGAEFFVRKSTAADAEYFVATEDGGVWTTDKSEATKYTTGTNGIVDVKGLEYGTYQLQETKAPEGYALPTGDAAYTEFVVGEDSYTTISATPLNIVNTPKGFLPSTGGAGIILFVALGAAMVGLAGVYFTSRRKDA